MIYPKLPDNADPEIKKWSKKLRTYLVSMENDITSIKNDIMSIKNDIRRLEKS